MKLYKISSLLLKIILFVGYAIAYGITRGPVGPIFECPGSDAHGCKPPGRGIP
ncbi:hypothetical protein LguiA_030071 [Lonicera macranthoides]